MDKAAKAFLKAQLKKAGKEMTDAMHVIDKQKKQDVKLNSSAIEGKSVVKIINSVESVFHVLPDEKSKKLTKIFINSCEDCVLNIEDSLLTQHLELIHCEGVIVNVNAKLLTLQLDLCKNIEIHYGEGVFCDESKVIFAGVSDLLMTTHEGHKVKEDYTELIKDKMNKVHDKDEVSPEQRQFVMSLEAGNLTTRRILKKDGHLIPSKTSST